MHILKSHFSSIFPGPANYRSEDVKCKLDGIEKLVTTCQNVLYFHIVHEVKNIIAIVQ